LAFKFKDLIIDVLHRGGAGEGLCGPATKPGAGDVGRLCGPATKGDPAAARLCGPATIEPELARLCGPATLFGGLHREDLATLKRQLQEALAGIERLAESEAEHGMPQSLAEVEDLEKKLQGALDELREHKKGLV
jgi:hypothetical protein